MAGRERASEKELISYKWNVVGKHPWHLHWINFNCGLSYSCTKPHTHICLLCRERPAREICTRNKYISLSLFIYYICTYTYTHMHTCMWHVAFLHQAAWNPKRLKDNPSACLFQFFSFSVHFPNCPHLDVRLW